MALELGPCSVKFGTLGTETSLGKTFGGVTVKMSDDSVDLKSDQYGSSAEDTVITGTTCEVELSLAELDFSTMATALNQDYFGASSNISGVLGENKVGLSLLTVANSLKLTKYVAGAESTNAKDSITFPAAAAIANVELQYDAENQRVMKLTFKCFPKAVSGNWGATGTSNKTLLYWFGDKAATS
jgi:hypothetical protein